MVGNGSRRKEPDRDFVKLWEFAGGYISCLYLFPEMHLNSMHTYTLTEEERNLKEDAFLVFVFVSKDASSFDGRIPQIQGGA